MVWKPSEYIRSYLWFSLHGCRKTFCSLERVLKNAFSYILNVQHNRKPLELSICELDYNSALRSITLNKLAFIYHKS